MNSTAPISNSIKELIIPALKFIDESAREAGQSQKELRLQIERLAAEGSVLINLMNQCQGQGQGQGQGNSHSQATDLEAAFAKGEILRKRIININKKVDRIAARLGV